MRASGKRNRPALVKTCGVAVVLASLAIVVLVAQAPNPHAHEPIGTVQQVYDGVMLPDVQVNTFRNIDRLFPTRTVKHGTRVYPLSKSDKPLQNFRFKSA